MDFNRRFAARFNEKPEQFASLAYDAMNALLDSICKAGLNRARIHDALADIEEYEGVTGHMVFDPNQKNVAPMYLGRVENGTITYRLATMEKQPAARSSSGASGRAAPCRRHMRAWAKTGWVTLGRDHDRPAAGAGARGSVRTERGKGRAVARGAGGVARRDAERPQWMLLPVESDQNWGAASTQLVHALMDEHVLAIVALWTAMRAILQSNWR